MYGRHAPPARIASSAPSCVAKESLSRNRIPGSADDIQTHRGPGHLIPNTEPGKAVGAGDGILRQRPADELGDPRRRRIVQARVVADETRIPQADRIGPAQVLVGFFAPEDIGPLAAEQPRGLESVPFEALRLVDDQGVAAPFAQGAPRPAFRPGPRSQGGSTWHRSRARCPGISGLDRRTHTRSWALASSSWLRGTGGNIRGLEERWRSTMRRISAR
jgi:hypothetical protein